MSARRVRVLVGSAACAMALALAPAPVAQAASSPGWRVVFTHRYQSSTVGSGYVAVTSPSKTAAWAVGGAGGNGNPATGRPVAARWLHGKWQAVSLPRGLSGLLFAVSADSAKDVWAISLADGYLLRWNGIRWAVARRWPTHGLRTALTGVTALSPSNVWVFGGPGAFPGVGTWHFNGHSWQHVTSRPGNGIVMASAVSAKNIWAIGSAKSPQDSLAHFTGQWHSVHAAALTGLQFNAISAPNSHDVWASGSPPAHPFQAKLVHLTIRGWSRLSVPWQVDLGGLAPDGKGGIWVLARDSSAQWALHRTAGGRWSRTKIGPVGSLLNIASIPGTTSLWGAGSAQAKPVANAAVWARGRIG
jgi:hypothetical protein